MQAQEAIQRGLWGKRFSLDALMAGQADGLWLDFAKTDRLFQESTGITPADDPNEVIGLALSQRTWSSKTLAQVVAAAPELVVNGDGTNTAGWTPNVANISSIGGKFRVENTDPANTTSGRMYRTVTCVVGRIYRLQVTCLAGSSPGRAAVNVNSNFGGAAVDLLSLNGVASGYFVATQTNMTVVLGLASATLGQYADYDDASIKEVAPQSALQTTTSFKPKLQASGAVFDGTDDNLLTGYLAGAGPNFIVAKVTVPASLAANQYVAGLLGAVDTRFYLGLESTTGQVVARVGGTTAYLGGPDLRGQSVAIGVTHDGSTVRVFAGSSQVVEGAQVGSPSTLIPMRVGAINSSGTASNFFGGSVKALVAGRQFFDVATFNKIAAGL